MGGFWEMLRGWPFWANFLLLMAMAMTSGYLAGWAWGPLVHSPVGSFMARRGSTDIDLLKLKIPIGMATFISTLLGGLLFIYVGKIWHAMS